MDTQKPQKKDNDLETKKALDEEDILLFKKFGYAPYTQRIQSIDEENKQLVESIKKTIGITESDTGLALPSQWNLAEDAALIKEHPLHVAECTKIVDLKTPKPKYYINLKQIANYVVRLDKDVQPSDVEEGM